MKYLGKNSLNISTNVIKLQKVVWAVWEISSLNKKEEEVRGSSKFKNKWLLLGFLQRKRDKVKSTAMKKGIRVF